VGEEADYAIEQAMYADIFDVDDMFSDGELQWRFDSDIWTGKDGRTYRLTEMSNRHLHNCIAHIEKFGDDCVFGFGKMWLPKLDMEMILRNRLGVQLPD
jgi:hypothetical protein